MTAAPLPPPEAVLERLRLLWSTALDLDGEWSEQATFVELGGYSILALSLSSKIGESFGIDVPRTLIFEQRTFEAVLNWVAAALDGWTQDDEASAGDDSDEDPMVGSAVDEFPMSPLQQAYVVGETGGFDLNRPAVFAEDYWSAEFNLERFSAAVLALICQHEMLRASFSQDGTQRVLPPPTHAPVDFRDLRFMSDESIEAELRASYADLSEQVPALGSGTVIWFRVFRLNAGYRIQVGGRLLAFDGASGDIFADGLHDLLRGRGLSNLGPPFREYLRARARTASTSRDVSREYWRGRLDELPPAPELPRRQAGDLGPSTMTRRTFTLEQDEWAAFQACAAAHEVTTTVALCAAFCEVLRHYSASPDFTLNIMHGARQPAYRDVARVLGNCSDTLLLACMGSGVGFVDRAQALGAQLISDLEHDSYSGVEVIRDLNTHRGATRSPAMPVVFASVIGSSSKGGIFLERLGWQRVAGAIHTPQVTFDHQVFDSDGRLVSNWDTVDAAYPPGIIEDMFARYREVLHALCHDVEAWQRRSPSLVRTSVAQLDKRAAVNDTAASLGESTMHDLVLKAVDRRLDAIAVVGPDGSSTYAELGATARSVAGSLRDLGCRTGDLVLLQCERGWRQVAAMLGVLIAGGAYVPLGSGWPDVRVRQVIDRTQTRFAIVDDAVRRGWAEGPIKVLRLNDALSGGPSSLGGHPAPGVTVPVSDPESLAYVIFTSGTTGEPKGVMIRHQSAVNTIVDLLDRFDLGPGDRVLALSDVTFDLSVFDVFGVLAAGGTVVIPSGSHARDIAALHELCAVEEVTIWNSVPAYLDMLMDYRAAAQRRHLPSLRLAMASGDWVPITLRARMAASLPHVNLVSLGGATEASIWSNFYPVPHPVPADWSSIPYGFPLSNQGFRVLDGFMRDRPDWVAGDLYITGRGLADGYLNAPELTEAAFVTHPVDGTRMYRTGDQACYWPDGTLEFLGRRDTQVKVNGMRVELSEVEAALLSQPMVRAAAAVVRADQRGSGLVGHIVPDGPHVPDERTLITHLRSRLPEYMVPVSLVFHENLPLTTNGKVDRERLKGLDPRPSETEVPAEGVTEETLLRLYQELVSVSGVTDDFFACGGHSVTAAVLLNRVEQEFGIRLSLITFHQRRTVRDVAAVLDRHNAQASVTYIEGAGDPLVFIHPVGGDIVCYQPLVQELAADHAVYGIAASGDPSDVDSVPEMARLYYARLRAQFADTPVRVVGWSFGAAVAYELAHLSGGMWPVVMLDPWVAAQPSSPIAESALEQGFVRDLSNGRSPDLDVIDTTKEAFVSLFSRYRANALALSNYCFTPRSELAPTIVTATDGFGGEPPTYLVPLHAVVDHAALPRAQWLTLNGDHFSVADPTRGAEVAQLVRRGVRG